MIKRGVLITLKLSPEGQIGGADVVSDDEAPEREVIVDAVAHSLRSCKEQA